MHVFGMWEEDRLPGGKHAEVGRTCKLKATIFLLWGNFANHCTTSRKLIQELRNSPKSNPNKSNLIILQLRFQCIKEDIPSVYFTQSHLKFLFGDECFIL